jgi:2-iminobutanoate/2-iminopropanoate deaminase
VHVYLRNMDDFATLNALYPEFFPEPQRARITVQSNLPGFDIEVDAVIALDADR